MSDDQLIRDACRCIGQPFYLLNINRDRFTVAAMDWLTKHGGVMVIMDGTNVIVNVGRILWQTGNGGGQWNESHKHSIDESTLIEALARAVLASKGD